MPNVPYCTVKVAFPAVYCVWGAGVWFYSRWSPSSTRPVRRGFKQLVTHWLLEEQLFQSSPSVFQMNVHENSPSLESLFNTRMHSDPDLCCSSLKWDTIIISCSLLTQISPFLVCNRIPAAGLDVQAPGLMAAVITFHWFVLILLCSSKTGKMNSEHKKHVVWLGCNSWKMLCLFTH